MPRTDSDSLYIMWDAGICMLQKQCDFNADNLQTTVWSS